MTNTGKSESMVDRVVAVMKASIAADDDEVYFVDYGENRCTVDGHVDMRAIAVAVINAMRDTDLVYAVLEPRTEEDIAYGRRDFAGDSGNWLWLWNKAIDAALKE